MTLRINRSPLKGAFLAFLVLLYSFSLYKAFLFPIAPNSGQEIVIKKGETAEDVAKKLNKKDLTKEIPFLIVARFTGLDKDIKPGRYKIPNGLWPSRILWFLALEGRAIPEKVTILEGLTIPEIAGLLSESLGIDSLRFVKLTKDSGFIKELKNRFPEIGAKNNLEGYLFPDTYKISPGTKEEKVIEILVERLISLWRKKYKSRADSIGWNLHKTLTLASIIEKEALFDHERPLISAVFHNRLRIGMPLESCATVEYLLPTRKPRLYFKDLQIDSPYNTYKNPGLPPGPIASPGEASIRAALYPVKAPFLYFVAKGDGNHYFATKWSEHLRNKRRSKLRMRYKDFQIHR